MSTPTPEPSFSPRGAVDLSALNRPQSPPPGEPGGAPTAGGYVVDVTDANFQQVVQDSTTYPVVILLWMPTDQANADLGATLGRLADEYAGRFLLGRVDANAYPQIASAFQPQGVPTVVAVLQGQPLPLFAGTASEEQIRGVLDQVLAAAEQNGVTGRVPAPGGAEESDEPAEEPEEPLPPLHQEAYDAIERDDLEAAETAYSRAITQDPTDAQAVAGLAQVRLMQRTRGADLQQVRTAAADAPADVEAQLAVADMDMLGGKVDDAFDRLLQLMPTADAEGKEKLRARLVDLFEVVGTSDSRVVKARKKMMMYLY
ncbi:MULTISPECIES: tetratricopeptide repeat protein [unclassified Isoptericola]|uniref:tetratricopeptide repeat protein n=1 Tax=unclassified Isoptericola TaxID=2623355 RepID=UPI002713EC5E|nr:MULTISPECIES: tetratricopeptide repeat protein [unclassified Isoptericola]MDO8143006.1 tetratricopeptide repeat protein [Isoptericola sp. 178]MDO8150818.1 tetratricopeptide repeat protein [Isoptericola sp. b408]